MVGQIKTLIKILFFFSILESSSGKSMSAVGLDVKRNTGIAEIGRKNLIYIIKHVRIDFVRFTQDANDWSYVHL